MEMNKHARGRGTVRILRAHIPCKPTLDHGLSWTRDPTTATLILMTLQNCEANSHNTDEVYVTGLSHHHGETEGCVRESKHGETHFPLDNYIFVTKSEGKEEIRPWRA